jgi:hypothetical protein
MYSNVAMIQPIVMTDRQSTQKTANPAGRQFIQLANSIFSQAGRRMTRKGNSQYMQHALVWLADMVAMCTVQPCDRLPYNAQPAESVYCS